MGNIVFVAREITGEETRVAASPETVKKMKSFGFDVIVEAGAGAASRIPDGEFEAAGARIGIFADAASADVVLKVRRPSGSEISGYKSGAVVIAIMDPYGNDEAIAALASAGLSAFAMELMPRITRAQSMDVLSSQANLAGYQAVIEAAAVYDRAMPMMMTAAGTVPAAKVFVMGAGVAGLQAIATPRAASARRSRPLTFGPPPRSRSPRSAPSSSPSRTRSSRRRKRPAAMPRKCPPTIRRSRRLWLPNTSPSRISSSPPR
ncbi:NAD/NADP transhydrogenase alpha subunit [Rhizobium leguminosarum]